MVIKFLINSFLPPKNGNQLSVLPRKTLRYISAIQYKAGKVMTREAASRHIPYGAFFHTERCPRKASRCISATQYKAGKVVTRDTASCQKPYGAFLQTKCYPRSGNGQSLKMWELPTCFTAISPETHGHWHSSGG